MAILKGAGIKIIEAQGKCQLDVGGEQVQGTLDLILDDPVDGEKVWDVKSASPYSTHRSLVKGTTILKMTTPSGISCRDTCMLSRKGKTSADGL